MAGDVVGSKIEFFQLLNEKQYILEMDKPVDETTFILNYVQTKYVFQ